MSRLEKYSSLIAGALLAFMAANLLIVTWKKSITIDEASAIPSGFYHLTRREFNINSEHPPVPKMLAAIPLTLTNTKAPNIDDLDSRYFSQRTVDAAPRFWSANQDHFQSIFFWARVPMILLTIATGLLVFLFARTLFGNLAALFAVALFAFEPNLLAHGRVIKDIHVAFAFLLFFYSLYLYWFDTKLQKALFFGFSAGLAPVMKFSMGIVVPIFIVTAIVFLVRQRSSRLQIAKQFLAASLLAILVVNAAYLFTREPVSPADLNWLRDSGPAFFTLVTSSIRWLGWLVPPYLIFGVAAVLVQDAGDHHSFLLGSYSDHGWWYYFPVAFAIKTTIPFLAVTVCSLGWTLWQLIRKRDFRLLILLVPVAIYLAMAIWTSIQIGIRHLIPIFPFLCITGGAILAQLWTTQRRQVVARAIVLVLVGWTIVEAGRAFPNYIPYMNQFASAGPRWTYLSDSNVEWGDDIGALASYLKQRGETRVRAALLGGTVILPLYGVEYVDLTSPPDRVLPETNYVAIGASYLNGSTVPGWSEGSGRETKELRRNFFAAWRNRQPEAIFGGTIYLYRVK